MNKTIKKILHVLGVVLFTLAIIAINTFLMSKILFFAPKGLVKFIVNLQTLFLVAVSITVIRNLD